MDPYVNPFQKKMIEYQCRKLKTLVSNPSTFIDIGVGKIGSEAWFVKEIWPDCTIIGYEPCKQRYEYLKDSYPGHLINEAIANSFSLEGYDGVDFVVSCREEELGEYVPVRVGSTSLDDIIELLVDTKNVVVWADVEGSELLILQGAEFSLQQGRIAALNLELNSTRPAEGWCTADEVIEFLSRYNYEPFDLPKEQFTNTDVIFTKGK